MVINNPRSKLIVLALLQNRTLVRGVHVMGLNGSSPMSPMMTNLTKTSLLVYLETFLYGVSPKLFSVTLFVRVIKGPWPMLSLVTLIVTSL